MAEVELSLINKVELRIALASNDDQFEQSLKSYLAPILLKLASPHAEVRKSVLKIIQNLIPRISAASTIKLPVEALLDQVKTPKVQPNTDPSSVRLYSLLFISRGIDRLDNDEKRAIVPKVIENMEIYSSDVSARLFNILCKLLQSWKNPEFGTPEYANMKQFFGFDKSPLTEKFLSNKISEFFMLQPNATNNTINMDGLGPDQIQFFTLKAGVVYKTQKEVFEVKTKLLDFLKSGFDDSNLWKPLLIASVDSSSAINDQALISFKKLKVNFDDDSIVDEMVKMFIGSESVPPVKSTMQEKIVQLLSKGTNISKHPNFETFVTLGLNSDNGRVKFSTLQLLKFLSQDDGKSLPSLDDFNKNMAAQLKNSIMEDGWPRISPEGVATISQRLLQYEALGNILRSNPSLFIKDLNYVKFLFESLEGEIADHRSVIQDALSRLAVHLPNLSTGSKQDLKSIIRKYLLIQNSTSDNIDSCRYIAIKYTNSAYPFNDSEARYFCILGTAKENKSDTIEEANKGLHPYWFNILQSSNTLEFKSTTDLLGQNSLVSFPGFSDFVGVIYSEIEALKMTENAVIFKVMSRVIEFAFQTLVMQSIKDQTTVVVTDEDWSVRLNNAVDLDKAVRLFLIAQIKSIVDSDVAMDDEDTGENSYVQYLYVILNALSGQYHSLEASVLFTEIFSKLLSMSPPSVIGKLTSKTTILMNLLKTKTLSDVSISQVCKSIGIIASHPDLSDSFIVSIFDELNIKNAPKHLVKGMILASSYIVSGLFLRQRISVLPLDYLKHYLDCLLDLFGDATYYSTILEGVSQMSIFGVLGPVVNQDLKSYLEKFIDLVNPKAKKCDEKSVLALAYLSLCQSPEAKNVEGLNEFEEILYETHVSKQVEFTFTSGEAFLILVAGWEAKNLQKEMDIQGECIKYVPANTSRLHVVLELVLKACSNTKPSLRKAGCIWLLSLVQFCGNLQEINEKAPQIHVAFMRFLSDRDELIQESASRGLSIVYEMGDLELKDTLVRGLLKSFTDTNAASKLAAGSVDQDTELFDKDVLKTNDGSVSTYRDVLNLATDVGDPSLVYKFMSLAKSSALWSSRKGIAFGLGSILSKSSLDQLLVDNKSLSSRLIPKLFRYKYDPITSVQQSMNVIWNTLIKDTPKTVRENFDIILQELLKSMGNKEWRTREASTAALNDLLQIVPLEQYEEKLEDIWNMSFRVLDDIKESVRREGTKLVKSLISTLMRTIEDKETGSDKSTEVLGKLIPLFLGNKGLLSDSEDVKDFSLKAILKICKIGGESIKPFVPTMIGNFVNLMSTMEPEAINYLILNADKYNLQHDDIDAKRLQSLGASPMMNAIEKLLNLLDDSNMDGFISKLQSSIKKSIGLPSKVCGSRILVTLITSHYELTKPYGDKLFKIAILQIKDKNLTIASSYATAAGHLCRIASISAIVDYSEHINKLYFESEDEKGRQLASISSENVAKYSADKFESVALAFLPLVFIGKHDDCVSVKTNFEREWNENTSGNNNSIKLYLSEIVAFLQKYINSNKFEIRKTLGKSISDLANSFNTLNDLPGETIKRLIDILIEANNGKSWNGKESVLEALVVFSIKAKEPLKDYPTLLNEIFRVMTVESKRKNKQYQKHAVLLLGRFIHEFPQEELVDTYMEIMNQFLLDSYYVSVHNAGDSDDEDDMDIEIKLTPKQNLEMEESKLKFLKNLSISLSQEINTKLVNFIFKKYYQAFESKVIEVTWRSKIGISDSLSSVVKFLIENGKSLTSQSNEILYENWQQLRNQCLDLKNIEKVKIQFIRFSNQLMSYYNEVYEVEKSKQIMDSLKKYEEVESSNIIKTELARVLAEK